jgi:hypothetical protein
MCLLDGPLTTEEIKASTSYSPEGGLPTGTPWSSPQNGWHIWRGKYGIIGRGAPLPSTRRRLVTGANYAVRPSNR